MSQTILNSWEAQKPEDGAKNIVIITVHGTLVEGLDYHDNLLWVTEDTYGYFSPVWWLYDYQWEAVKSG